MGRPVVDPVLVRELHRPDHRAWHHARRLAAFAVLYAAAAYGAYRLTVAFPGTAWVYVACLPLYLLAAASLHGISLFTHEAVHGTLAARPLWNRLLGAACAVPVLQNFSAYRVLHLQHHDHLGQPGDPDHYHNYTRWTWLVFAM
ncbi:MAG: Fatty acid desaturase, partial [uncultured Phycisphaerae bacterium]